MLFHGAPSALDEMLIPRRVRFSGWPLGPTPYFAAIYAFGDVRRFFFHGLRHLAPRQPGNALPLRLALLKSTRVHFHWAFRPTTAFCAEMGMRLRSSTRTKPATSESTTDQQLIGNGCVSRAPALSRLVQERSRIPISAQKAVVGRNAQWK